MNVSLLYITVCTSPSCFFFFFNDTATTEIYTLSLHDALPICSDEAVVHNGRRACGRTLGGRWNYRCSANDGRCHQPFVRGTHVRPAFLDQCAVLHGRHTENRLRSFTLQSIHSHSAAGGAVAGIRRCRRVLESLIVGFPLVPPRSLRFLQQILTSFAGPAGVREY